MVSWLALVFLLGWSLSWQVREASPFQHNFVVALYRNGQHICNGALHVPRLALVPSICISKTMINAKVELFRHNLNVSTGQDEKTRPPWTPETNRFHPMYLAQTPRSVCVLTTHTVHQLSVLYLESTLVSNVVLSLIYESSDKTGLTLVGWGETNPDVLIQTTSQILPSCHCEGLLGYSMDSITDLCIQESSSLNRPVYFKDGTPLVKFTTSGPVLTGLLTQQYKSSTGISMGGKVIKIEPFLKEISRTLNLLFKISN
ncbi:Kallikrein 1- peptidase b1 [Entomophthora muscae]|uniref:Kallikrein 1- peptidase b1 n=1 Tax=Entomophthora muscae TaxID=34485 RepID=A0ACC2RYG8_9FUNG|nr:Kallikrein 1- peptidase b1 [Entomophthora muscae]